GGGRRRYGGRGRGGRGGHGGRGGGGGRRRGSGGTGGGRPGRPRAQGLAHGVQFGPQLRRGGEVLVPLQQHARGRGAGGEVGEDVEHRPRDGMGVAVVPHAVPLEAAGDMDVGDGLQRQAGEGLGGVLAAVDVVGVQVGDVDEQPHAGAVG